MQSCSRHIFRQSCPRTRLFDLGCKLFRESDLGSIMRDHILDDREESDITRYEVILGHETAR